MVFPHQIMGTLSVEHASNRVRGRQTVKPVPAHHEEPKELDSDNEAVAHMHEGIRRILSKAAPKPRTSWEVPEEEKHVLHCSKILKMNVERRLVNIVVEKMDGGLRQIRIEATDD
jgi:hypothetical protein